MSNVLRFLGIAGAVLMLFGLIPYAVSGRFDLWTAIHLTGGAILAATGLLLNLRDVRSALAARGVLGRGRSWIGVLLFAAIVITVNVLASRSAWQLDLTENRVHSLSPTTIALLEELDRPVELLAFLEPKDPRRPEVAVWLERFARHSRQLIWRSVAAVEEPELARALQVREEGQIVAKSGEQTARMTLAGPLEEGALSRLLVRVLRRERPRVGFLVGRGAADPRDLDTPAGAGWFAAALDRAGIEFEVIEAGAGSIPDGLRGLVLVGPEETFTDDERAVLADWFAGGGGLMVLVDPGAATGLEALLAARGIEIRDDIILDRASARRGAPFGATPLVEIFAPDHPVVDDLGPGVELALARSVDLGPGRAGTVLARTGSDAWAETDYAALLEGRPVEQDDRDRAGPVPVAVAVEDHGRLVVVGDSQIARNTHIGRFANEELVVRAVQWLVGAEDEIGGRPAAFRASRLDMSVPQERNLFRLTVLLLPETVLLVGLAVWWRRRRL